MKVRIFPEKNYKAFYYNGKTMRIAIDPSKPIEELDYPEFLDVKITDFCLGGCPYCYMDSTGRGEHSSDILAKVESYFGKLCINERPFQVAIGGGEPTSHPEFIPLLKLFHELGITPNYTTNGMFIGQSNCRDILEATSKYSGGVAVSCHTHLADEWATAASMLQEQDVKLNFHHVISDKESIDVFRRIYDRWEGGIDYFVLLPYGVQGRAEPKEIDWEYLLRAVPEDTSKLAFGANFYPYLRAGNHPFNVSLYEPESMSKFLDLKDMTLYPSSFHTDTPLME